MNLIVGHSYKIDFGGPNPNNRVVHVRAIVDDDWVVTRTYSQHKQRWYYSVEYKGYYEFLAEEGHLKERK